MRLQELDAALKGLGVDSDTRGVLCNGDAAARWGKTNLQDLQDLRAHFNDMHSNTTLRKRKRYEDAEASEEDESGNVVRPLNMGDMDVDDGIESLRTSEDNIISKLSKLCTLYASSTSQSACKKARTHLKTVCEILEEVCEETEESTSTLGEARESGDEDEDEEVQNDDSDDENRIITSPISARNLFDSSRSEGEEENLAQADLAGQHVPTSSSVDQQVYWQGTQWDIVVHADA